MNKVRGFGLVLLLLISVPLLSSGCALFQKKKSPPLFLSGGDTVEGKVPGTFQEVWYAARETLKSRGTLTYDNIDVARMEADIGKSHVIVWQNQITIELGVIRVRAYKTEPLAADISLAQSIYEETAYRAQK